MNVGAVKLIAWLKRTRTTQQELADRVGVHFTTVSQWTRGERQPGMKAPPGGLAKAVLMERVTGIPLQAWGTSSDGDLAVLAATKGKNSNLGRR